MYYYPRNKRQFAAKLRDLNWRRLRLWLYKHVWEAELLWRTHSNHYLTQTLKGGAKEQQLFCVLSGIRPEVQ